MWTYDKLKENFQAHKQKIILLICFGLVFIVGFGVGKSAAKKSLPRDKVQSYYTAKKDAAPETPAAVATSTVSVSTTTLASCVIKGNISSGGRKIYHVPGGAFYDRTQPEQCFNTEAEAQAAGYVKSQR